ncbi:hypothetical protein TYRP_007040 [Tyrophagus putrescentiae]|nr:hypothetical protein TYRP_007040 [Tyrophagus putrescentiae]
MPSLTQLGHCSEEASPPQPMQLGVVKTAAVLMSALGLNRASFSSRTAAMKAAARELLSSVAVALSPGSWSRRSSSMEKGSSLKLPGAAICAATWFAFRYVGRLLLSIADSGGGGGGGGFQVIWNGNETEIELG